MNECLVCGHQNPVEAGACGMCGERLIKHNATARDAGALALGEGSLLSYGALPQNDFMAGHAWRARRFMIIALALLSLILVVPYAIYHYMPNNHSLPIEQKAIFTVTTLYALFVHAFLLGKTAQAIGAGFWSNFLIALFPPLIPAAWARIGGGSMIKPYIWLVIDCALIGLAWYSLRQWPWALPFVILLMGPLLISQVFGCVVGNMARALGLNNYITVAWICIAPLTLFAMMAMDLGLGNMIIDWAVTPGTTPAVVGSDLAQFIRENAAPAHVQYTLLGWLALTVFMWLKSIYDNLKFPFF